MFDKYNKTQNPEKPRNLPTSLRETFESFRFYRREFAENGVLMDVDTSNYSARQIFHACHGRAPGSLEETLAHQKYTGRELFVAAVSSDEFQQKCVQRFVASFPEKSRMVFVHIPKCAGSDMSTHLIGRFPSLNTKIIDTELTDKMQLFDAIKDVSLEISISDFVYIHGHTHLQTYVDWGVLRFEDHVFTTIRNPEQLIVSQINYVLTRMNSDETPVPHDTEGWRKEFGIADLSMLADQNAVNNLASKILRHRGVVPANVICTYLGDGTSHSAISRVAMHNVEVTNLEKYHKWIEQKWGIVNHTRMNESKKYISIEDFSLEDRNYIYEITHHDQRFFNHVKQRLEVLGTPSLTGVEILTPELEK